MQLVKESVCDVCKISDHDLMGKHHMEKIIWSSENRSMADAWELRGEEGRDKLRKAAGRSKYPVIRG